MEREISWLRKLLWSALITVLFFAILEGAARWYGFRNLEWDRLDAELGWGMKIPSETFSKGPPEEAKIVVLGDSITYGNLPAGKAFSQMLDERGFPTVNLSAIGYGTDQEFLLLQRWRSRLPKVKMVVLNFCLFNDFLDNGSPVNPVDAFRRKPYFEEVNGVVKVRKDHIAITPVDFGVHFMRQRSGTVHFMIRSMQIAGLVGREYPERIKVKWNFGDPLPEGEVWQNYHEAYVRGVPITREILLSLQHFVEQKMHANLLILLFPTSYLPKGRDPLQLDTETQEYFTRLSMTVYDLGCHFRRQNLSFEEIAYDRVGHLTALGEEKVGEVIIEFVHNSQDKTDCSL